MPIYSLNEATKKGVQLKVYFRQAFDSMRKADWDTKSIDKCIRDIENARTELRVTRMVLKPEKLICILC